MIVLSPRLRAMLPLFAAVFIDLFSFGLMYPVIVALFRQPAIDAEYLPAVRGLYLSLAFSLFPFGMFFGASLLGDISDAYGRRRTLLICMAGLAASYLLILMGVQSGRLPWLLAGRLLSGLMAGTSPIAQAAMMDGSTEADRGRNMSSVVLVNCIALVSGPMIGGVLGHFDLRLPLLFAMLLCAIAFVWIRGTADRDHRPAGGLRLSWRRPFQIFAQAWRHRRIRGLALSFLLFQTGFALYYIYVQVRMSHRYGISTAQLGLFSALMGVGFVIGSTALYAWAKRLLRTDARVAAVALALCGGLILVASAPLGAAEQWALALLVSASNVPAFVALLTLISGAASADEQGWALGIGSAMVALSFFLSGLFASALAVVTVPILIAAGGLIVAAGALPLRAALRREPAVAAR